MTLAQCRVAAVLPSFARQLTGRGLLTATRPFSGVGTTSCNSVAAATRCTCIRAGIYTASSTTSTTHSSAALLFSFLASTPTRALHSSHSALVRSSSGPVAAPNVAAAVPSGPTYDAPLPSLEPVSSIDPSELHIDPSAVRRLRALSAKHGRPVHLRVLVDQGGCSGLEYKFNVEIDTQPEEEDIALPFGASSVYVDRDSWLWLRGSRIQYAEELARAAFEVADNPNASQACGCKSSFAPKVDPRK